MTARKFQGDKLVTFIGAAGSAKRIIRDRVVAGVPRQISATLRSAIADFASTFKVQAKLQTPRMKTASPIDRLVTVKIVPLHTDAKSIKVAIQLPPAMSDMSPCLPFCGRFSLRSHAYEIYGFPAGK